MNWTTDKPTKAGVYWYREPKRPIGRGLNLALVTEDLIMPRILLFNDQFEFMGDTDETMDSARGEWAGPLEPPR